MRKSGKVITIVSFSGHFYNTHEKCNAFQPKFLLCAIETQNGENQSNHYQSHCPLSYDNHGNDFEETSI